MKSIAILVLLSFFFVDVKGQLEISSSITIRELPTNQTLQLGVPYTLTWTVKEENKVACGVSDSGATVRLRVYNYDGFIFGSEPLDFVATSVFINNEASVIILPYNFAPCGCGKDLWFSFWVDGSSPDTPKCISDRPSNSKLFAIDHSSQGIELSHAETDAFWTGEKIDFFITTYGLEGVEIALELWDVDSLERVNDLEEFLSIDDRQSFGFIPSNLIEDKVVVEFQVRPLPNTISGNRRLQLRVKTLRTYENRVVYSSIIDYHHDETYVEVSLPQAGAIHRWGGELAMYWHLQKGPDYKLNERSWTSFAKVKDGQANVFIPSNTPIGLNRGIIELVPFDDPERTYVSHFFTIKRGDLAVELVFDNVYPTVGPYLSKGEALVAGKVHTIQLLMNDVPTYAVLNKMRVAFDLTMVAENIQQEVYNREDIVFFVEILVSPDVVSTYGVAVELIFDLVDQTTKTITIYDVPFYAPESVECTQTGRTVTCKRAFGPILHIYESTRSIQTISFTWVEQPPCDRLPPRVDMDVHMEVRTEIGLEFVTETYTDVSVYLPEAIFYAERVGGVPFTFRLKSIAEDQSALQFEAFFGDPSLTEVPEDGPNYTFEMMIGTIDFSVEAPICEGSTVRLGPTTVYSEAITSSKGGVVVLTSELTAPLTLTETDAVVSTSTMSENGEEEKDFISTALGIVAVAGGVGLVCLVLIIVVVICAVGLCCRQDANRAHNAMEMSSAGTAHRSRSHTRGSRRSRVGTYRPRSRGVTGGAPNAYHSFTSRSRATSGHGRVY